MEFCSEVLLLYYFKPMYYLWIPGHGYREYRRLSCACGRGGIFINISAFSMTNSKSSDACFSKPLLTWMLINILFTKYWHICKYYNVHLSCPSKHLWLYPYIKCVKVIWVNATVKLITRDCWNGATDHLPIYRMLSILDAIYLSIFLYLLTPEGASYGFR